MLQAEPLWDGSSLRQKCKMSLYAELLVLLRVLTTITISGDLKPRFWPGCEASRAKPHGFRQPDRGPVEEG